MIQALAIVAAGIGVSISLHGVTMALHAICEQIKRLIDLLPTAPTSGEHHGS